jgi:hypothetical protein
VKHTLQSLAAFTVCVLIIFGVYSAMKNTESRRKTVKHHIKTEHGVNCVSIGNGMSCNWDKYNHDTNYGKYPYATE